jgi:hypothetical protein
MTFFIFFSRFFLACIDKIYLQFAYSSYSFIQIRLALSSILRNWIFTLYISDLRFPLDGSVRLHFSTGSESRLGVNETHTRYTVESSTGTVSTYHVFMLSIFPD